MIANTVIVIRIYSAWLLKTFNNNNSVLCLSVCCCCSRRKVLIPPQLLCGVTHFLLFFVSSLFFVILWFAVCRSAFGWETCAYFELIPLKQQVFSNLSLAEMFDFQLEEILISVKSKSLWLIYFSFFSLLLFDSYLDTKFPLQQLPWNIEYMCTYRFLASS